MKRLMLICLAVFLAGCGAESTPWDNAPVTDVTPNGYQVSIANSIIERGIYFTNSTETDPEKIRNYILSSIDYQVALWLDSHPDYDRDYLLAVAHSYVFRVSDHFAFRYPGTKTGIAYGLCNVREKIIDLTLYLMWYEDYLPVNAPPHLMFTAEDMYWWTGNNYWIENPREYATGLACTSIDKYCSGIVHAPHELGHAIGEHHPIG